MTYLEHIQTAIEKKYGVSIVDYVNFSEAWSMGLNQYKNLIPEERNAFYFGTLKMFVSHKMYSPEGTNVDRLLDWSKLPLSTSSVYLGFHYSTDKVRIQNSINRSDYKIKVDNFGLYTLFGNINEVVEDLSFNRLSISSEFATNIFIPDDENNGIDSTITFEGFRFRAR